MDIFGVIIIASVTAIGGGSVRDVLLGHYPLGWVKHPEYIVIVAGAAVLTVIIAPLMRYLKAVFLILDALGLIVFSIIGAQVALTMGHGFIIASVAAIITGAFGGVLRDLLCNRIPLVFQKNSTPVSPFLLPLSISVYNTPHSARYCDFNHFGNRLLLRLLAIRFGLGLPVFDYQEDKTGRG